MGQDRVSRIFETNQQWRDRKESQARLAFERKVIRKILAAGGVSNPQRKVMRGVVSGTEEEERFMTFAWMRDEFPEFPFILFAAETEWKPASREIFMGSSKSSKIWAHWSLATDSLSKEQMEQQVAVFIPCSDVSGLNPAVVLHNAHLPEGPFEESVPNQVVVRLLDTRTGNPLYLQHIDYFVRQVALKWTTS